MRLSKDLVLRQIAGQWVILPLADNRAGFAEMLRLNASGVMLWHVLEKDCRREALVDALISEYQISPELAQTDVDRFLEKLAGIGCIEL